MNEVVKIQLEWKYAPENYFEEPIEISLEGVEIVIADGIALANIEPRVFEGNDNLKDELNQIIESNFHAVQIMKRTKFELNKPSRSDLKEDGKRNHYLEVDGVVEKATAYPVDIVVKDKDGNIISDTKRDRLKKQEWVAKTAGKFRSEDKTLDQMFKSYEMSVNDPDNEFVHLYEIRDALSEKFGTDTKAKKKLNITKSEWNEIGDFACKRPLKQGRHRGKSAGVLRDATKEELEAGRKSVYNLIVKYLEYLDKANCP